MKGFKKWSKHRVGDIEWVNKHRDHPHRSHFIDYIKRSDDINKIVEIGGGEMIEAKELIKDKDIKYTIVDVSSSFLENAKKIARLTCIEASMHELPFKDKQFDLIYLSSVIEHSPDIKKTIKEICRVSKNYYITMFKWKMKSGDLISQYREKKEYYSTLFNLPSIIGLLKKHSNIEDINISLASNNNTVSYKKYKKNVIGNTDKWRNGDRLNVIGNCN
tara:strand:+ start:742 stop:1395 length:654 start_codon:yes stop_codon:yes gene_type:complete